MWNVATAALFEILPQHLSAEAEESQKKHQASQCVSQPLEVGTF